MSVNSPSIRAIYENNKRILRYTVPSNEFKGEDLENIGNVCPDYTLKIPNEPFRKNFEDNEIWFQMKNYADLCNMKITGIVECLNAQKDKIATYNSSTIISEDTNNDGIIDFPEITTGTGDKQVTLSILNKSYIIKKQNLVVSLVDNNSNPIENAIINLDFSFDKYTYKTDSNGKIEMPINLNEGVYSVDIWYDGDDNHSATNKLNYTFNVYNTEPITTESGNTSEINELEEKYPLSVQFGDGTTTIPCIKNSYLYVMNKKNIPYQDYMYISLTDGKDNAINNAKVKIAINDVNYEVDTNNDGVAKLQINLTPNREYDATITYDGGSIYNPCETKYHFKCVVGRKTKMVVNESTNICKDNKSLKTRDIYVVADTLFKVKLLDVEENDGIPYKTVWVEYGGKRYTARTNTWGDAYIFVNSENTYNLNMGFDGDKVYQSCRNNNKYRLIIRKQTNCGIILNHQSSQTVNKKINGKNVPTKVYNCVKGGLLNTMLRETSSGRYAPIKGRDVTFEYFKDNKKVTKTIKTDINGYCYLGLEGLDVGEHIINYSFKGDYYFKAIKGSLTINIIEHSGSEIVCYTDFICPPDNAVAISLRDNTGGCLPNQYVTMECPELNYKIRKRTDYVGSVAWSVDWTKGSYDVLFYCDKMNGEFDTPNLVKQTIEAKGESDEIENIIDNPKRDYTISKIHLKIPEIVNDETEYLTFKFYITPPCEIATDSIKHNKFNLYIHDFMVNTGAICGEYQDSKSDFDIINFTNTYYALLYSSKKDNIGMEIIRPNRENINSKKILRSDCTVFAPFYYPDIKEDRAENIVKEYLNMYNQNVNITQGE